MSGALAGDGTSVALGADERLPPDRRLLERLVEAGARPTVVASTDLFYDHRDETVALWTGAGALAVEMETAAIFAVAWRRNIPAACVLGVTDVPSAQGTLRATREQIEAIGLRVGDTGYAGLKSR